MQITAYEKVIRNSHISYNRTIHLYFLDAKFQLLGICCSGLYLEETTTFFLFRTQLDLFCFILFYSIFFFGGGGSEWVWGGEAGGLENNSSKQRQNELTFCPQVVLVVVQLPFKGFRKAIIF